MTLGLQQPEWQEIDPILAALYLEGNLENRRISKRVVARYAKEMREGRWKKNGSTISIFDNGKRVRLLNGQHRLLALIEADVTLTFLIVPEESEDVFNTIDTGYNRNVSQLLSLAGHSNTNALQAMCRIGILMEDRPDELWGSPDIPATRLMEWLDKQDQDKVKQSVHSFTEAHARFPATNTWYAGLCWLVLNNSADSDKWIVFHEGYTTGANLPSGSPILTLRQYTLNRSRASGKWAQSAWDRQAHLAVGVRAWNDWLAGREVQFYRFMRTSLPMPMPK